MIDGKTHAPGLYTEPIVRPHVMMFTAVYTGGRHPCFPIKRPNGDT